MAGGTQDVDAQSTAQPGEGGTGEVRFVGMRRRRKGDGMKRNAVQHDSSRKPPLCAVGVVVVGCVGEKLIFLGGQVLGCLV